MTTPDDRRGAFRALHQQGTFVMPNPFDVGSARLLAGLGFQALATTSAGFAATLGRPDMSVSRDELVDHVARLAAATELPLNVDAERCYADDEAGVAETVRLLADAGGAGCSIEDWNPASNSIDPVDVATARVAAAASAAADTGMVLTARCENHLHGVDDLDDTISRLCSYRDAGADVLYAPGMFTADQVGRIVGEVGRPVNVLLLGGMPTVEVLTGLGVRRISLGNALSNAAYGAVTAMAQAVLDTGALAG
jgi:2-methylisocitrate lyase-like PEP mutase family enzyme